MARKVQIELIDDLDGSTASQTVGFALDGVDYEIDLTEGNAAELRSILSRFADKARRNSGRKKTASAALRQGPDTKAVRAWALAQGLDVNPRGRISEAVLQQYLAAN